MYSYYAYGLGINSELEIPEFSLATNSADIVISTNTKIDIENVLSAEAIEQSWALHVSRDRGLVYVKDTGLYTIERGREITFTPVSGCTAENIRFYLVGTVMAILLYQRKFLVLHGSVVDIDGEAVIFLGNSGDGKSSTAAALHAEGYNLINDDVAPIIIGRGKAILQPGFPQIKMGRETARVLNYDFDSLTELHQAEEKRGYRPQYDSLPQPMNIRRIYVLGYGSKFAVEAIAPSSAVKELAHHSRPTTLYHQGDALHFFQCANLIAEQNIYRLERPKSLELLPRIVEFVLDDLNKAVNTAIAP